MADQTSRERLLFSLCGRGLISAMARLKEYLKTMKPYLIWYVMAGPLAVEELLDPLLRFYGIDLGRYVPKGAITPVLIALALVGVFYSGFLAWSHERDKNDEMREPYLQAEADKKILRDLLEVVPSGGTISFLRTNNFGVSFSWKRLNDIERFLRERDGPDYEFLDPELETVRNTLQKNCRGLLNALAINTHPTHIQTDRNAVPGNWKIEAPERFGRIVEEINTAADAVCNAYDELVRLARKKLAL